MESRSENSPSPWWYRQRAWFFWSAIWLGCFLGYVVSAWWHLPSQAIYQRAAMRYGPLGWRLAFGTGLLVLTAGVALRLWGAGYLHGPVIWSRDALAEALIADGPFRFVRHPLYVGNFLLFASLGVLVAPLAWLGLLIGAGVALELCAAHEERLLAEKFGPAYDRYCRQVPRWFPRRRPAAPAGRQRFSLREALRSEWGLGLWMLGMLALVLIGPRAIPFFWVLAASGLVLQGMTRRLTRKVAPAR